MGIELIAKLFGLGIVVVIAELTLKSSGRDDIAFWIKLGAMILCMVWVIPEIAVFFETVQTMFNF